MVVRSRVGQSSNTPSSRLQAITFAGGKNGDTLRLRYTNDFLRNDAV